ncbi:MAG TPA: hypothetical protein VH080_12200 [Gemmatimonadaceae bacterium]|nr:hypothetical protein [Gemmatimonadaceae bacterium]
MKLFVRTVPCMALIAACAGGATAQTFPESALDLSFGCQVMHIPGQTYPLGMSGAVTDTVRIVGEAGVSIARHTTSTYGKGTLTLYFYGAGPRVTASAGRLLFYGQVLGGGVHTHADLATRSDTPFNDGDNAFMLQPGAGVIVPLTKGLPPSARATTSGCSSRNTGGITRHVSSSVCEWASVDRAPRPDSSSCDDSRALLNQISWEMYAIARTKSTRALMPRLSSFVVALFREVHA